MTTVLCNGVFDIFHYGHARYLQAASKMGDKLVVSVTRNKFVNKGPNRPLFDEHMRLAVISSVRWVDEALLTDGVLEAFEIIKPNLFVKGKDYIGKIEKRHSDYCKAHGIEIRFTNEPIYSATKIINARFKQG